MADAKEVIAKRIAKELKDGDVVNIGIGIPNLVPNFLPPGVDIVLQGEHGVMGMGPGAPPGQEDLDLIDSGGNYITLRPGAMFFDSATSYGIIRGGHVDVTILGAMEVDAQGNLANWIIPGKMVAGTGGAMDLAIGAKKVIVAMTHTQKGRPKILTQCSLPCTALHAVDLIVTEMAVLEVTGAGLVLREVHPDYTLEQVRAATQCRLIVSPDLKPMA